VIDEEAIDMTLIEKAKSSPKMSYKSEIVNEEPPCPIGERSLDLYPLVVAISQDSK
jgi:hypothetical protein